MMLTESIRVKYVVYVSIHWNDYIDLYYIANLKKYALVDTFTVQKHEKNIDLSKPQNQYNSMFFIVVFIQA